ncbi:MAG: hypothetical protein NWT08_00975 [Akkermansiaceae bacterium]|jgi:hypothetical protein|nr:hypothetical protein [Akkermansiaceae bacterium]MDP4721655.1 hypothetical protein [Akkermansiaceae bacterium]MDP4778827.1 hypothetical protein [Akkermansiaceae bacterium]MDP4846972.1 hypothetical protein [Akkermansiaceae bacterium]MDP4997024.1 hypothetical protein [Akkermansiaceae bacterium]
MISGWKDDLTPLMQRISQIASGTESLLVIAASSRLALALPANRKAALIVANLYQPHRWKGRLFLALVKWLVATGFAKFRPNYHGLTSVIPKVGWLVDASSQGCVGFLGCNPNHGPRCVLAGIDPVNGDKFIAKLGLDKSAAAVRREAGVLEKLSGRFPGVVRPMGLDTSENNPLSMDSASSFDWALLRLPHLGTTSPRSMADPKIRILLEQWLGKEDSALVQIPWADELLECVAADEVPKDWHRMMKSREIRTALLHGDFAVWNLRKTQDGLMAIDWEWGVEASVAGIDLAHGLRQECFMVGGMNPKRAVEWMLQQAGSSLWSAYLDTCGWSGAHEDWLRLGLLHSHFNALNPSGELLGVLGIHLKS